MAFTYDTSTQRGRIRFLTADTREDTAMWTDGEIDLAIAQTSSEALAIVYLCRAKLAHLARLPDSESTPDGSVSRAGQREALLALIEQYGGASDHLPTISVGFPASLPMDRAYTSE